VSWEPLGVVTVGDEWQSFPVEAIGSETFRISQSWNIYPYNPCLISQYFALPEPGGRATTRRLYPNLEPRIITLMIPPDLKALDLVLRTLQTKLILPQYAGLEWQIQIEALY
jgi:hypothetical protein